MPKLCTAHRCTTLVPLPLKFCADHWRKLTPGFLARIHKHTKSGDGRALTAILSDARRWLAAREAA